MSRNTPDPKKKEPQKIVPTYEADVTPRREGGDDAIAELSPTDSRSDEKVIVNEQIETRAVNGPSQTGAGINREDAMGDTL